MFSLMMVVLQTDIIKLRNEISIQTDFARIQIRYKLQMTTLLLPVLVVLLALNAVAPQTSSVRTTTSGESDEADYRTSIRTTTSGESDEFTSRNPTRTTTSGEDSSEYTTR
ncbi:unnamed protein product [Cylicocyclus nassatus]|uniref:Uncharacterized protein n=1 Tax=Cylicocyclus nassatus TaxID=53992 RepID=A0AA36GEN9_CYLNA|nr:unnamed protein product [Cylicocyclus nassatus]